ncbi:TetR/AcrR family transcriptional regulator [Nocardioides sp. GY 10127]|nr:TetR/AcrR family transcriptional regulator [Nocardioides sp. GY 10127]
MSSDERREEILAAATRAFAAHGYHGTSTDAVAREAGISQPYVVRMFGGKLALFLEVFASVGERVDATFAAVVDERPFDPDDEDDWGRLGHAYKAMLADDPMLLPVLLHGFAAGAVPEIGAVGRRAMGRIFATVQRTGCTPDAARDFLAHGMLLTILGSMGAPAATLGGEDSPVADLTRCTFGELLTPATEALASGS